MLTDSHEITITIGSKTPIDDEELSQLSGGLREDLIEAGAESVERSRRDDPPAGAKGDSFTLSSLLVTLAPTAISGLITMLQSWLTRHERASLTLQRGGEKIILTGTVSQHQRRVISEWLQVSGKAS